MTATIDLGGVDEKKSIDRRVDKTPEKWRMIVFFARDRNPDVDSLTGHAYIAALTFRPDIDAFVTDSVFGLYPDKGKEWLLDLIDGDGGVDIKPADADPDAALLVWVNPDIHQAALDIHETWKKSGQWTILIKDCVSMISAIASEAGLNRPGPLTVLPIEYIRKLMELND